jgi:hypothetical protein
MANGQSAPGVTKFRISLALNPQQVSYIGLTAAAWSYIEWLLMRITETMLQIGPKEARVISGAMPAIERIKVARLLATLAITDDAARDGLNTLLDRADKARSKRNDIVHGIWGKNEEGKMHLVRMKGGSHEINRIKLDPRPMTEVEFEEIAVDISNVASDMRDWHDSFKASISAHERSEDDR